LTGSAKSGGRAFWHQLGIALRRIIGIDSRLVEVGQADKHRNFQPRQPYREVDVFGLAKGRERHNESSRGPSLPLSGFALRLFQGRPEAFDVIQAGKIGVSGTRQSNS
jgi:hypothetical protein